MSSAATHSMTNVLGKKTKVLLEASAAVPADDALCCGCGCLHTKEDCVVVKFEGFASDGAKCSECDCYGNSTYILRRGVGYSNKLPGPDTPPVVLGSVRADRGSGAELAVSLAPNNDGSHSISSVAVANGGSGYDRTAEFSYSVPGGASVGYLGDPVVKITTTPANPTVTVTTPGKSSAKATLANTASDAVWGVTKIEVVNVGSGVSEGAAVSLATQTGYAAPHATAFCLETHGQATATVQLSQGIFTNKWGSGAEFSLALSATSKDEYGRDLYSVASASVVSKGSGYYPEITTASIAPTDGSVAIENATLKLSFGFQKPALRGLIFGFPGEGATISLESEQVGVDSFGRELWGVSKATVVTQGSGYMSNAFAQVDYSPDEWEHTESAQFQLVRNQDGGITAVNVTQPGKYYATRGWISGATVTNPGLYRKRTGGLYGVIVTSAGAYYGSGPVTKAEVIDGGKFWNVSGNCLYLYKQCASCPCPADPGDICTQEIELRFSPNMRRHEFAAIRHYTYVDDAGFTLAGQEVILAATTVNQGGDEFSSVTFKAEDFTKAECEQVGKVTVTPIACESQSKLCCEMPEQISLSLSGMGDLFLWSSGNGGFPGDDPFGGECGVSNTPIMIRGGGSASGIARWFGSLVQQDATVVLDRVDAPCQHWAYQGLLPIPPGAGWVSGFPVTTSCNGELGNPVSVGIAPVSINTTVYIDPPTKGPAETNMTATADVAGVTEAGAITGVNLTYGGSGYAREIIHHEEPTLQVNIATKTGAGASITPILTKVGEDPETRYWYVSGLKVENGGAGYHPNDSMTISCSDCPNQPPSAATFVLQREEPELTATAAGGTGAVLEVTLLEDLDYNGNAVWRVSGVTVTAGGDGYSDYGSVKFAVAQDDIEVFKASAVVRTKTTEPTLTLDGNAQAQITLASNGGSPETWGVASVTVTNGGSGYADGSEVIALASLGDQSINAASLVARTVLVKPDVTVSVFSPSGTGASLTATLTQQTDFNGRTTWTVDSITVVSGGVGYSGWDFVSVSPVIGQSEGWFYAWPVVDQDGTITSVNIYSGGTFYRDTGVLASVQVNWPGSYSRPTGVIEAVEVSNGGWYYKTNGAIESATPDPSPVSYWRSFPTGQVTADSPAVFFRSYTGTNGAATATVDKSLSSETFGQITSINLTNGGQNYWEGGIAWMLSIGMGGFFHREVLLGNEKPPAPDENDPRACVNYFNKNLPVAHRVAYTNCPVELLSKSYKMSYSAGSPFGDPSGEDLAQADWCHTITQGPAWQFSFFGFGGGDITVSLSPAGGEE